MEVTENVQQARMPRSTQSKTPARYVLTPTPPQRRLINGNTVYTFFITIFCNNFFFCTNFISSITETFQTIQEKRRFVQPE